MYIYICMFIYPYIYMHVDVITNMYIYTCMTNLADDLPTPLASPAPRLDSGRHHQCPQRAG